MRNHLCLKHKILLETKKAKQQVSLENSNKSSTGASTIENYFKPTKESLERIVAELAVVSSVAPDLNLDLIESTIIVDAIYNLFTSFPFHSQT